jgi:hypothetical protein
VAIPLFHLWLRRLMTRPVGRSTFSRRRSGRLPGSWRPFCEQLEDRFAPNNLVGGTSLDFTQQPPGASDAATGQTSSGSSLSVGSGAASGGSSSSGQGSGSGSSSGGGGADSGLPPSGPGDSGSTPTSSDSGSSGGTSSAPGSGSAGSGTGSNGGDTVVLPSIPDLGSGSFGSPILPLPTTGPGAPAIGPSTSPLHHGHHGHPHHQHSHHPHHPHHPGAPPTGGGSSQTGPTGGSGSGTGGPPPGGASASSPARSIPPNTKIWAFAPQVAGAGDHNGQGGGSAGGSGPSSGGSQPPGSGGSGNSGSSGGHGRTGGGSTQTNSSAGNSFIGVGPIVNVTPSPSNVAEVSITADPTNPNRLFMEANAADQLSAGGPGIFIARSTDGGQSWIDGHIVANGTDSFLPSEGDPSVTFDKFGNLFMSYIDFNTFGADDIYMSTDDGVSFTLVKQVFGSGATPAIDQPTIVVGPGAGGVGENLWTVFNDAGGTMRVTVAGAPVLGRGRVGNFSPLFFVPNSDNGNFGDIAVGPDGQVMVTFQHATSGTGPDTIDISIKRDGFGNAAFSNPTQVTTTNIGGFTPIPPQPNRTIDAEAGLAWDRSGGPHNGRVYLMYTDSPDAGATKTSTQILMRHSDDNGRTWSDPVPVNDSTGSFVFLPKIALDQTTGNVGVSFYDTRNDLGTGGVNDTDGVANDEPEFFAAFSFNGGMCFSPNVQVTTSPSSVLPDTDNGFDYGDYTGATFLHGVFHPAWADNSASLGITNPSPPNLQIATAAITVPSLLSTQDVFEPNDTSDRAHSFGALAANSPEMFNNLTVSQTSTGFPDYDWFRWAPTTAGTFTASMTVLATDGSLELHVFTVRPDNTLVELGSVTSMGSQSCNMGVQVAVGTNAGQPMLVEVKGTNSALGVHDHGIYDLTVELT